MPDSGPHGFNARRHAGESRACLERIPKAKLDSLAFRVEARRVNAIDFGRPKNGLWVEVAS